MLKRGTKRFFYSLAGPLMELNGWRYRRLTPVHRLPLKVHLGPGQQRYLAGWVNVDANMFTGQCDIWADLRNPLPFHDGVVDACYSHHVIEHLPNLQSHLGDIFRCLKPGGVLRIGGPNGDAAISKFVEGDKAWFSDFPVSRESIGGRLENFIFCRQEHLTILTESFLTELLSKAGFVDIQMRLPVRETGFPEHFGDCLKIEHETNFDCPHTLIVECAKPG